MSGSQFFQIFLYASNWDIVLNLVFIAIALVYILLTGPLVKFISGATPVSGLHRFSFIIGLMFYYFAEGSPLTMLSHELFSMHMAQMTILYIVMPPLLLLGIPEWFVRPLLKIKFFRSLLTFFTKPLIILFIFNGLLSVYHVPAVFDMIMENHLYHNIAHTILLITALCMWWPVICPVEELDKVKPLHKLAYIFANGVLLTPACALIMFADATIYPMYSQVSAFSIMTPLQDQQTGGVIMKITQEVVYITAIALVFSRWFRIQRAQDEKELAEWKKSQLATDKP
ncbi:cytochrome c oxidase assembly protein [Shimazuella sp. AN120528]|uniref:cytochrome c oxidase assembly protein n=1 Tax=Shimazuella soli TaxID=1892854 RepID=UPI001F111B90|nr:cytochrome c oxidase assembly protein [Shimazuella soli]MCH5585592.1 cytochrome c oxidase assembly protein [Shimazuella soli]